MRITLELDQDQECIEKDNTNSSLWIFKLNGQRFPNESSFMTFNEAHEMAYALICIERKFNQF